MVDPIASHSTSLKAAVREIAVHVINQAEREKSDKRAYSSSTDGFESLLDGLFKHVQEHLEPTATRLEVVKQLIRETFDRRTSESRQVFDDTVDLLHDVIYKRVFEKGEKGELEGPCDPDLLDISCWDSSSADWEQAEKTTTRLGYESDEEAPGGTAYFQLCTPGGMPLAMKHWLFGK